MAAADRFVAETRTYGNWRRPASAGLGSLGMLGTALLLVGMIVVLLTIIVAGLISAVVVGLLIAAALGTLMYRDRHHRTVLQRMTGRVGWMLAKSGGSNLYRSGPLGKTRLGTFQLPGLLASSTLNEGRDSYGRPFAIVHYPSTNHYAVAFSVEPDGAALVDQAQMDQWVAHWGQWLATLGDEPGIVGAAVTIETAPDSGARLRREVDSQIDRDAAPLAVAMLDEVVHAYPEGSASVRGWITLTFSGAARAGTRKRDADDMLRDLATRLPGLAGRLTATGAGTARPVTGQQLCEIVRVAYEPRSSRLIDAAYAANQIPELSWNDVGPSAAEATWSSYRHDSAVSVSWSMTSAPRGEVQSLVLQQLLSPHNDIARKRVTLLYTIMDSAQAARTVENDKRTAEFRASSTARPSARAMREQRAAEATAREEAKGAALVNFGLLVTATVDDVERLPEAEAAIDNLSATARISLRPVYGSQDSAFAAGLPVGLVLSKHLRVPSEIRAAL